MTDYAIIGSAHLDILSEIQGKDDTIDSIGNLRISYGGTGYNLAINLSLLGSTCRFVSALQDCSLSRLIEDSLKKAGVETFINFEEFLPLAGFSAHVSKSGTLKSAVSSTSVDKYSFSEKQISSFLDKIKKAVILDFNLSIETLNAIIKVANAKELPVFVAAVSQEKALKLRKIQGFLAGVFMNELELSYLFENITSENNQDLFEKVKRVYIEIRQPLVITLGSKGSMLIENGTLLVKTTKPVNLSTNDLGAGDAFMSYYIKKYFESFNKLEVLAFANARAQDLLQNKFCNLNEEKIAEQAILNVANAAFIDKLTKVYSRAVLEDRLEYEKNRHSRSTTPFSVALLDIDFFKKVNDNFGHDVGDIVLASVAKTIKEAVRANDVVGRWGGEEFLVLMPDTNLNSAIAVANRIRSDIEKLAITPKVTVSIGVCEIKGETSSIKSLVKSADLLLYQAKQQGRNRVESKLI